MTVTRLLVTLPLFLSLFSCATLANGRLQRIDVMSEPSEADVVVDCGLKVVMKTPARVPVLRKAEVCTFEIAHEGYETQSVTLGRGYSRWYWVNVGMAGLTPLAVFGETFHDDALPGGVALLGIAGLFVDRMTGAAFDREHTVIDVRLRPLNPAATVKQE